jgi:hypothetical protein
MRLRHRSRAPSPTPTRTEPTYLRCCVCGGQVFSTSAALLDAESQEFVGIVCLRCPDDLERFVATVRDGLAKALERTYTAYTTNQGGESA